MKILICPFFREPCLLNKCAAFEDDERCYPSVYHVYDKKETAKEKEMQKKWVGSRLFGFGDKYEDVEVEVDVTRCYVIKHVEVRKAKCSALNAKLGNVVTKESTGKLWHKMSDCCLSIKEYKEKPWLKIKP